jgi:hypothetical protein
VSKPSPTSRSLAECKRLGWLAQVVEKRVPHKPISIDLFGCIDIVAVRPGQTLGIQACAGASHAARLTKAMAQPKLRAWLEAGNQFEVWSWAKRGARGKAKRWAMRRDVVTVERLDGANRLQVHGNRRSDSVASGEVSA